MFVFDGLQLTSWIKRRCYVVVLVFQTVSTCCWMTKKDRLTH